MIPKDKISQIIAHKVGITMLFINLNLHTQVAVLGLCLLMVEWLFLAVPWGCLRSVIVANPDHTHYFLHDGFMHLQ